MDALWSWFRYLYEEDGKEIPVNKESRYLLYVVNKNRYPVKIQIITKYSKERNEIRTESQVITLKKNQAYKLSVIIRPLCICDINDKIHILSPLMKRRIKKRWIMLESNSKLNYPQD